MTIERYRKIAAQLNGMEKIIDVVPNSDVGVFFVTNRDILINLFETFKKLVVIQLNETKLKTCLMSSPKINLNKNENKSIVIHKGEIIYVGESEHLTSRYRSHMDDKLSGAASMKFGLREKVFGTNSNRYFDTFIIRKLEKFIRNYYNSRFGK